MSGNGCSSDYIVSQITIACLLIWSWRQIHFMEEVSEDMK